MQHIDKGNLAMMPLGKHKIADEKYLVPLSFTLDWRYEWAIEISRRTQSWYFRFYERSPYFGERWEPYCGPYTSPEDAYVAALEEVKETQGLET